MSERHLKEFSKHGVLQKKRKQMDGRNKMNLTRQTNWGNTTSRADQYLSSLLQLAFVISKLLLNTDLLKGADRKSRDSHMRGILTSSMQHKQSKEQHKAQNVHRRDPEEKNQEEKHIRGSCSSRWDNRHTASIPGTGSRAVTFTLNRPGTTTGPAGGTWSQSTK